MPRGERFADDRAADELQNGPVSDDQGDTCARDWDWDFGAILRTVPGVSELIEQGFTPVETLFGEHHYATRWPDKDRREVLDTRFRQTGQEPADEEDLRLFLVRSPWASIELHSVVKLMHRWLRRNDQLFLSDPVRHAGLIDREAELAVVEQFFRQSQQWVRAYSKGRVNRLA